ncbi:ribonuclease P protein component [Cohaesibacter sp. ES.047]|uniref:ribonuclease P protein component n=1 Tax=Cohaesibacter sp. ES.047 TaxID=1798205 RepID=UPI000BB8EBC0|nr:ribonuclease P protein component [Cohaesibacter sp. ES.047]SNY90456.1 ribonuclease P protein component [Cohaesibacter sp. ES.047]
MLRLKKRSEFLTAAKGVRLSRRGFVLQVLRRKPEDDGPPRVGFTVTKKVGNAVVRNRVKRRLREIARLHGSDHMQSGWDYVLIGRIGALHLPFDAMVADFKGSLRDARAGKGTKGRPSGRGRRKPAADPVPAQMSEAQKTH